MPAPNPHPLASFLHADSWTVERALFLLGFALLGVSPLPFAAEAGPEILLGPQAFSASPALLVAFLALVSGIPSLYALAGVATLVPAVFIIGVTTGGRILANPLAGGEFVAQALLVASVLIALPAGVMIMVRSWRGVATPIHAGFRSRQVAFAVGIVALVAGAVLSGSLAAQRAGEATSASGGAATLAFEPDARLTLVMEDMAFSPATLALGAGDVTELRLENRDPMLHTFTYEVDGDVYEAQLLPGASTTIVLRLDAPGDVAFWCAPHATVRDGVVTGMSGVMRVA